MFNHFIKHITYTGLVYRGYRKRLAKSKVIKLIYICLLFNRIIYLINYQNHRFFGLSKHMSYLIIRVHKSGFHICYKYNYICCIYSYLSLFTHIGKHHVACIRLYTTCVYHCKCLIEPLRICVYSVSGYAGSVFHYRNVTSCKFIKKCGLTYIRSSHYRYYWFQISPLNLLCFTLLCNFTLLRGVCKG